MKNKLLLLMAPVLLAVALSLYSVAQRHRVEARNKAVALAAEYETIEALAAAQGMRLEEALQKLKMQGLNALVLSEETIAELGNTGRVYFDSASWAEPATGTASLTSLAIPDRTQVPRVERGLRIRLRELAGPLSVREGRMTLPPVSAGLVRATAVGLSPEQARVARGAGMLIVGRMANPTGLSADGVRETLRWARDLGATVYLPMGDQVLGRREAIAATTDALQSLGMLYASPEFAKIGGDANVVARAPQLVVRLHSAQTAELDKLPMVDAVERYGRAARERNMRMLLLRPVSQSGSAPLNDFGTFVKQVHQQILREGGQVGSPRPFVAPDVPRWLPILISVLALPGVVLAAVSFTQSRRWLIAVGVLLVLVALAAVTKSGLQISAFLIAIAYPVAGFGLLLRNRVRHVLAGFALATAFSVAAGLIVAGMLNDLPYAIQAEEFRGVKLSVFLPVLLVGGLCFARLFEWRTMLRSPITWGTAALGMILLAALAFMIARTGNDTGAGASSLELAFRNLLDRFLYVRPRTKEFLVGHPMMIVGVGLLGITLALRSKRPERPDLEPRTRALAAWTTLAMMLGAVGQTSIVNTFTHLHIPVLLSVARVAIGIGIGCMIGLGLWTLLVRLAPLEDH